VRVRARDPRAALRPAGLFAWGAAASSAYEARDSTRVSSPAGRCSSSLGARRDDGLARERVYFLNALVAVAIVVALYVFVGNSGVLSFGQISFVAVGASRRAC
jgi:ABC-type branched-subunit amino acid transport system permease subunit